MKKTNKKTQPIKSEFYKLDKSAPLAVEGYKSVFPLIFLIFALFFCAIFAGIVIGSKSNGSYDGDADTFTIFYIVCGVLLGVASALFISYHIRNALIKKKILAADVTLATITSLAISYTRHRDSDGDTHVRENLSFTYAFYDKDDKVRTEHFSRSYNGRAPEFYEGQQIVVAFTEKQCYILSKYTLLDASGNLAQDVHASNNDKDIAELTGEAVKVDKRKIVPLGYDKRYYVWGGIYFALLLIFLAFLIFNLVTSDDSTVLLYYVIADGVFSVVLAVMALRYLLIPFKAKRRYDAIKDYNPTYTAGKLITSNKVYGNNAKHRYLCVYLDSYGAEHSFKVDAEAVRRMVRVGNTDVVVAYTLDKAVALVSSSNYDYKIR